VLPSASVYWPGAHAAHSAVAWRSPRNVPTGHGAHAPYTAPQVPAAHGTHSPLSVRRVSAAHTQPSAPGASVVMRSGHGAHASSSAFGRRSA
jgi:hypothetical protein